MKYKKNADWKLIALGIDSILSNIINKDVIFLNSTAEEIYLGLEELDYNELLVQLSKKYDCEVSEIENDVKEIIEKFLFARVISVIED